MKTQPLSHLEENGDEIKKNKNYVQYPMPSALKFQLFFLLHNQFVCTLSLEDNLDNFSPNSFEFVSKKTRKRLALSKK